MITWVATEGMEGEGVKQRGFFNPSTRIEGMEDKD